MVDEAIKHLPVNYSRNIVVYEEAVKCTIEPLFIWLKRGLQERYGHEWLNVLNDSLRESAPRDENGIPQFMTEGFIRQDISKILKGIKRQPMLIAMGSPYPDGERTYVDEELVDEILDNRNKRSHQDYLERYALDCLHLLSSLIQPISSKAFGELAIISSRFKALIAEDDGTGFVMIQRSELDRFDVIQRNVVMPVISDRDCPDVDENEVGRLKERLEDPDSMCMLGTAYMHGTGVEQSFTDAERWYSLAATFDHVNSLRSLGIMHLLDLVPASSPSSAVSFFKRASELGDPESQFWLGMCFNEGTGVDVDIEQYLYWIRKSAEKGFVYAEVQLGVYYYFDSETPDYTEALKWFNLGAEHGSMESLYCLGGMFHNGDGVEPDADRAIELFTRSADLGYDPALFRLGLMRLNGIDLPQSYEKAVELFRSAIEAGSLDAMAELGDCYFFGTGVEQSYDSAFNLYYEAAEKGAENAFARLGVMYSVGFGCEQSYEKAFEAFIEAGDDPLALVNLGTFYSNGYYVEQSDSKAFEYAMKAAEMGQPDAQKHVAESFYLGKGVEQSYESALRWYLKCAESGDIQAIRNIAVMIEQGLGTESSESDAMTFYRIAASHGDEDSCIRMIEKMILDDDSLLNRYDEILSYINHLDNGGHQDFVLETRAFLEKRRSIVLAIQSAKKQLDISSLALASFIDEYIEQLVRDETEVDYPECFRNAFIAFSVIQSFDQAQLLFRKASESGNADALLFLGIMAARGEGTEKSPSAALRFLAQAKDGGNRFAEELMDLIIDKSEDSSSLDVCVEKIVDDYDSIIIPKASNDDAPKTHTGWPFIRGVVIDQSDDELIMAITKDSEGFIIPENGAQIVRKYFDTVENGDLDLNKVFSELMSSSKDLGSEAASPLFFNLGMRYLQQLKEGDSKQGVRKKAKKCFLRAAEGGCSAAKLMLGRI